MEVTLTLSKTLDYSGQTLRSQLTFLLPRQITPIPSALFQKSSVTFALKSRLFRSKKAGAAVPHVSVASSGGWGIGGGAAAGKVRANPIAASADDVSPLSSDVIILDVRGMTCGGCSASVQRILENQAQVASATVNLTTETAIVSPVSEAKDTPNWQKVIGEELAKQLTTCGFTSTLREGGAS